jgi:hypothetical protein
MAEARCEEQTTVRYRDEGRGAVCPGWPLGEVEGSEAGTELLTFTVITTDPNAVVEPLHDRMPVIIPERDYDRWLKADPDRPPIDLLRPFDADKMTAWKVDKAVGNVKNDRPELIEPSSAAPEGVEEGVKEDSPGPLFSDLPTKQVDGPPKVDKQYD